MTLIFLMLLMFLTISMSLSANIIDDDKFIFLVGAWVFNVVLVLFFFIMGVFNG